jgi:2-oxo-4-hydroxy-4-carboxy-5-ureidoimidazoline decarboxylase
MTNALERWNGLSVEDAENEIVACCGSRVWARQMVHRRPITDEALLLSASDDVWNSLSQQDWIEAFESHPRIGESRSAPSVDRRSTAWSSSEQHRVSSETDTVKAALAEGNREYERRFGRIFIVCATGKTGAEILEILRNRLHNDRATEIGEAAEQQRQITRLRLRRWLSA